MLTPLPRLIGVIHLPALPGAPGATGFAPEIALRKAGRIAVKEAQALQSAGFDGIILENFGDRPFYKDQVPPETVAAMAILSAVVREAAPKVKLGINILRNDARAALAIAAMTGCDFIRVNVLTGVVASDQGLIEGAAATLVRERDRLGAEVAILADAHVKHARTLHSDDLALAIEEVAHRGGAQGVIITGPTTGRAADLDQLEIAARAARDLSVPLYAGSGVTPENLADYLRLGFRVIVGSALRRGGQAGAPLDAARIKRFIVAAKKRSGSAGNSSRKAQASKGRRGNRKVTT